MDYVADDLSGLNHTGPDGHAGDANTTLRKVALATSIESLNHPPWAVMREWSIIRLDDDEGVFGETLFRELFS